MPLMDQAINVAFMQKNLYVDGAKVANSNVFKAGLIFGRPGMGMRHAYHQAMRGQVPFAIVGAGMAAGMARRHNASAQVASSLGSTVAGAIGFVAGGAVGSVVASEAYNAVGGKYVDKAVQAVTDLGLQKGRVRMGGDFEDSERAWTMRQVATREMSRSMLNARRYLGQESVLMHT